MIHKLGFAECLTMYFRFGDALGAATEQAKVFLGWTLLPSTLLELIGPIVIAKTDTC